MKKCLSILLACIMLLSLFSLSGCHGSRGMDEFVIPEEFDDSRSFEITFWAKNDTNKTQTDIYHKAISDFEKIYPNIKVNIRLYTDYSKIYNDVITNISTNTTPNVCITYPDHIATYMTGINVVVPLDELFENENYGLGGTRVAFDSVSREELIPEFLDECMISGTYYAIPYMRSTEACYVNRTYVEKLGYTLPETLTWDFVWEVSEAALKKNADGTFAINGQNVMIPFIYKSSDNMMITMLRQKDAPYSTDEGAIGIFNDTTSELLLDISGHTKSGAFSTFKVSGYPANFLNAGQCIFAVDSTAGATWMGSHAPLSDISEDKFVEFETEVMTVPQFDPADPKMISQGPSICIFNKEDPQEVLSSWLFAQYMLTNDVQIAYSETEGYVPVTSRARDSAEYRDYISRSGEDNGLHYYVKIKASELLTENTENTFVTPVFNGSASLREAASQLVESVVKSTRRREAVNDEYIEKLYSNVTSLYRLDSSGASAAVSGRDAKDLGPLPKESVILLSVLAGVWVLIGAYYITEHVKKKTGQNS